MREEWRSIPGASCYSVSTEGRVRREKTQRILKPVARPDGYFQVSLGRGRNRLVQHLVLDAFRGPRGEGQEARHTPDPDPANNSLANLQWGTRSENEQDKRASGTYESSRPRSAHVDAAVPAVLSLGHLSERRAAEAAGVSPTTVRRIRRGERCI